MHVLRIEHAVPSYDRWKKAFDHDPVGREKSGVRSYRVFRPTDDPNYVMIDLDFDSVEKAEAMRAALQELWGGAGSKVMVNPRARIVEVVEDARELEDPTLAATSPDSVA